MYDIGTEESEENVLVVTHGGWLKNFVEHLISSVDQFSLFNINHSKKNTICGNTGITRLELYQENKKDEPRQIVFTSFYDIQHLTSTGKHSVYADGVWKEKNKSSFYAQLDKDAYNQSLILLLIQS